MEIFQGQSYNRLSRQTNQVREHHLFSAFTILFRNFISIEGFMLFSVRFPQITDIQMV